MKLYKILGIFIILTFSLGCIASADDENEELSQNISSLIEVSSSPVEEPNINSRAAIVYERTSGKVLFEKNENEKRKMASTTKIMTAIIVLENSNLNDVVTVSAKAAGTGGSRLGLHKNDKVSVRDLLYGLLLCSGNDAAVALAEYVSGSVAEFAVLMNSKTTLLGLTSTHFVTPHGLDNDEHYTTAYELAIITDYALKQKEFCNYVGTKNYTVSINGNPKNLSNTNELLGNLSGVYGVKTGFTNGANRCLVTAVKRDNMDIICIVLGADTKKNRTLDSIQLIEYAFGNFKMVDIGKEIRTEFNNWKSCTNSEFSVNKGISNNVDVILNELPFEFLPVNCNYIDSISIYIYCATTLEAPLQANTAIGYLTVSVHGKNVLSLDLYNSKEILKKNSKDFFKTLLQNYVFELESLLYKKIQ